MLARRLHSHWSSCYNTFMGWAAQQQQQVQAAVAAVVR
jgi:hypothetical protein